MGWYARTVQWFEDHRFAVDAVGAALFALFAAPLSTNVAEPWFDQGRSIAVWSVLVAVPLAWRRVRPVASAIAVFAVALAHLLMGFPLVLPADAAVLVALYSVTVYGPRWAHLTAISSTAVGCLLFAVVCAARLGITSPSDVLTFLPLSIFLGAIGVATWAFGLTRRYRRVSVEALHDRAARLQVERDQQAQIATATERARIAREMHDIVAHSLSVVIAQADGGRYASRADPEAAQRALLTISETGRAALADMRRILGVLREDDGDVAHLVPQPGDSDIAALVSSMREVLPVSLVEMGAARPMPPGTGSTIYRIAQEALTNILKHGGPGARATMLLQWAPQRVVLQVDDDGRGAAATSDGGGHGLLGMRERATMLGGTLVAGPRAGGGYRVRAEIPIPGGGPSPMPDPPLAPAAQHPTDPPYPTP